MINRYELTKLLMKYEIKYSNYVFMIVNDKYFNILINLNFYF